MTEKISCLLIAFITMKTIDFSQRIINIKTKKMKLLKNLLSALAVASVVLMTSCTSDEGLIDTTNQSDVNLLKAGLKETFPAAFADTVAVNPLIVVNFKSTAKPADVAASVLTLKQGTVPISGTVTFTGTTVIFKPETYLASDSQFTATIKTNLKDGSSNDNEKEYSWTFRTGNHHHKKALSVVSVAPLNEEINVAFDAHPTITFSKEMDSKMIELVTFTLNEGTTVVEGSLTFVGKMATFIPTSSLKTNTLYTGTITINSNKNGEDDEDDHYYEENDEDDGDEYYGHEDDDDHNHSMNTYIWSFTTVGSDVVDITAPTVLSVVPENNTTSIAVSTNITANFSEAMDASSISTATFTLKQGTTNVAGSVSYSGTTATFNPSNDLDGGLIYTANITTGAKDAAGNAMAASKEWRFTTLVANEVDTTAPTILSIVPSNNATSIVVSSNITVTFSEAMDASSISTATFSLKQGTTNVAGSVSYSGTTATFNPNNDLVGGLVYIVTITTGVKDASGNALAASKVWSFTTLAPVVAGLSFSTDVMPTLGKCNNCHTHSWATSTIASTYYTNLVNGSYVNPTDYTSSKIYKKLIGGHPGGNSISTVEINKIIDWMKEGSKNN
jgi:hypothetical protein